jgi:hypothetical protein
MFNDPNDLFQDNSETVNALLQARLTALQQTLRSIVYYTREDYQAAVYSALNAVLNLGNNMTPLQLIHAGTPAIVGNLENNLSILNNDAQSIVAQITDLESQASELYNLSALTQNSLRQQIRERLLFPTSQFYVGPFLNQNNLDSTKTTAALDYSIGLATLPLISETALTPDAIEVGPSSLGSMASGSSASQMISPTLGTVMTWNGAQLELRIEFDTPQIVNRLELVQDNYQGLYLQEFTCSDTGSNQDNIISNLTESQLLLNASSGKFTGNFILDFPPRTITELRLVLQDITGQNLIALRGINVSQRLYDTQATVQSNSISQPSGEVYFNVSQNVATPLVNITHLISYDDVHFQAITPGSKITLTSSPFWYQAALSRMTNISELTGPLLTTTDPGLNPNYNLVSSTTINLGANIVQRSLVFSSINGPLTFIDDPLSGTFAVYQGANLMSSSSYTFNDNVLLFPNVMQNITVTYQASTTGTAGLQSRLQYFSPYLYQVSFEQL